jgi:lipopolysaccharide export system permease protein
LKTLSKFILRTFAGPFVATFFIAVFILLMQFIWKHIDDMVGKGLEWYVIVELLAYISASLVPLALPLAILLSSLMAFGNLGENYELIAFKSAGISLKRVLRPLTAFVILLSIAAFLFANYLLPIANLKSRSLLYDVREQKPAMDLQPGIFSSELNDLTIRVGDKKQTEEGERLYDIMIYDHSNDRGNRTVTLAKEGIMNLSDNKQFLELRLFDGKSYDEQMNSGDEEKFVLTRVSFKEDLIRTDLSEFQLNRTDEDLFKTNYKMLNIDQLTIAIDSLEKRLQLSLTAFEENLDFTYSNYNKPKEEEIKVQSTEMLVFDSIFNHLNGFEKERLYKTAANLARSAKSKSDAIVREKEIRMESIHRHEIEWHRKYTLSFACIILFSIGAPLGAIIRKGGLGMPMVISVIFFLIYHMVSITGEKMAKEGALSSFEGMWLSAFVLLPIGVYLTYKATTDSALLSADAYNSFFAKLFKKKLKENNHTDEGITDLS